MIPGTTPTFIITLKNVGSELLSNTKSFRVDIRQKDLLLKKRKNDKIDQLVIDYENNTIAITLTQEESSRFLFKKGNIDIQIHGLLQDNKTAWKTYIASVPVERTLSQEVIK